MQVVNGTQIAASEAKPRSVADLKYIVELHGRTLDMNGAKTSPVLLKAAAEAVAEYEAAKAKRDNG